VALSDDAVWCLSDVCLSVVYIGSKSRTERHRKTKIGTEVTHVTRDSDTSRSKGEGHRGGGILWRPPTQLVIIRWCWWGCVSTNVADPGKSGLQLLCKIGWLNRMLHVSYLWLFYDAGWSTASLASSWHRSGWCAVRVAHFCFVTVTRSLAASPSPGLPRIRESTIRVMNYGLPSVLCDMWNRQLRQYTRGPLNSQHAHL